jgi:glycolate oxidase
MQAAERHGLFYPPDPASCDECTIGGNVAENAGGLRCKKYGVTRDYVIGLKAVAVNGDIIKTGIYSSGDLFDLTSILLGSEGLLAAVVEIAVRLIDWPETGPTILAAFDRETNAARSVSEIIARGLIPSVMEYLDGDAIAASNNYEKTLVIEQAAAVLLLETTGRKRIAEADAIEKICRDNRAVYLAREDSSENATELWRLRRNLSKAVKASARVKIAEDICVPPSRLPELTDFVAQLNREYPIRVNSYGHAGDGNLHVNFLVETDTDDFEDLIHEGIERLFEKTLQLGGTLSGEHGIGLTKKKYLPREFDPSTLTAMRGIKDVFDPGGLLNPGKIFL